MKMNQTIINKILKARAAGYGQAEIAKALNVSQPTVSRALKAYGQSGHIKKTPLNFDNI